MSGSPDAEQAEDSTSLLAEIGLLLILGLLFGSSASAQDRKEVPIAISPSQEVAWGETARAAFLKTRPLSHVGNLAIRADRIGPQVARVGDRPHLVYTFPVVGGEEPQAFSFPGCTVCLTEALARLHASDDELAFGLGHELSHIVPRHHVSQLRVREALKEGAPGEVALLETVKGLLDRDSEMEADWYGALYAVRAQYRFSDAVQALRDLSRASSEFQEDRAHPTYSQRIEALNAFKGELELALEAFRRGAEALRSGKADEAISLLSLFVAAFPDSVPGRVNLGAAFPARLRVNSGTPENLAEVLPILPDSGILLCGTLDLVYLERARENFERALRTKPDHALARAALSLVHARLRQLDDARPDLTLALSTDARSPEILLCLGNVEYLAGNPAASASLYLDALSARPGLPDARKTLALSFERMGDRGRAGELWASFATDARLGAEARRHLENLDANKR